MFRLSSLFPLRSARTTPIGHYVVVARCHDLQLDRNHVFRLSPSLAEKLSKGTWPLVLAAKHAPTRDVVLKIVRDECLECVEVAFIERSDDSGEFHHVRMRLSHSVLLKEAHLRSWTACGACSGRITLVSAAAEGRRLDAEVR